MLRMKDHTESILGPTACAQAVLGAGKKLVSPCGQLLQNGKQSRAGIGEGIRHPGRLRRSHRPSDEPPGSQFRQPVREHRVGDGAHTSTQLGVANRAGAERTQDDTTPPLSEELEGGFYGAGSPREGWDYASGWMKRILAEVWKFDLEVVEEEFTLVGVNPALDEFKEMAVELRAQAEQTARERGRNLVIAGRPAPEVVETD